MIRRRPNLDICDSHTCCRARWPVRRRTPTRRLPMLTCPYRTRGVAWERAMDLTCAACHHRLLLCSTWQMANDSDSASRYCLASNCGRSNTWKLSWHATVIFSSARSSSLVAANATVHEPVWDGAEVNFGTECHQIPTVDSALIGSDSTESPVVPLFPTVFSGVPFPSGLTFYTWREICRYLYSIFYRNIMALLSS